MLNFLLFLIPFVLCLFDFICLKGKKHNAPTRTFQLSLESDTRLITLREKDLKLEAKGIKTAYLNPINLEEDSVGNWIRNEFIFSVAEGQF